MKKNQVYLLVAAAAAVGGYFYFTKKKKDADDAAAAAKIAAAASSDIPKKSFVGYSVKRDSQYAIVALTRLGAVLANQELLLAFIFRKNNWIKRNKLQLKSKENHEK